MSINSEVRRSSTYHGNGATTVFSFPFKVFSADQLKVIMSSQSIGDLELTYNVDYTASLNADQEASPGGSITLLAPLAVNFDLVIKSDVPYTQLMKLTNSGFYPTTMNDAHDKAVILIQQVIDQILNPLEAQALQRISYAENFSVTGTNVHIDFPTATFILAPAIYICINGAVTEVTWVFNQTIINLVTYYSSIDITFQAGAVGKTFSLIAVSNG
jgi:hypothetical protein